MRNGHKNLGERAAIGFTPKGPRTNSSRLYLIRALLLLTTQSSRRGNEEGSRDLSRGHALWMAIDVSDGCSHC